MKISDLLDNTNVMPDLAVSSKIEAIDKLVESLSSRLDENTLSSVRKAVMERENIMSTGVGKGLAIPHGKSSQIDTTYAAFAKLRDPIDYDAIDSQPVHILFLLVGPESQNSIHIKMLSRISRLLNSTAFREKLLGSDDAETIIELFRSEEQHFVRV
ncbi:PTS sugar transporter subunit IIA [Balneolales bacterium ANBcel1]|nr:PTS sugar transporter subunit IIA [Balneolales bacterium ANBcel1]